MKMVLLDGGLFNQVTQYIFARDVEIATGETVYLDDSWFFVSHHESNVEKYAEQENHKYQLNKFLGVKPSLLSDYFTQDVWDALILEFKKKPLVTGGSHMPQLLKNHGLEMTVICEPKMVKYDGNIVYIPYYHYIPQLLEAQGNIYYHGYFTHGDWFMRNKEVFRRELTLPPLQDPEDIETEKQINSCFSVGVHIRRGGYAAQGIELPASYYQEKINELYRKNRKNIHFFIFSDEIDWCKDNAKALGIAALGNKVTFGRTDRTHETNQCDFQLMTMCDSLILSQSVYGYYAALLSPKNQIVINPIKNRGVF